MPLQFMMPESLSDANTEISVDRSVIDIIWFRRPKTAYDNIPPWVRQLILASGFHPLNPIRVSKKEIESLLKVPGISIFSDEKRMLQEILYEAQEENA